MLVYQGKIAENIVMEVDTRVRNPYDAVVRVCVNSARPLKDVDRIIFIAENIKELDLMCEVYYKDWCEFGDLEVATVKQPTHQSTPTLH